MIRNKLIAVMAAGVIGLAVFGGSGYALAHEGHDREGTGQTVGAETARKGKNEVCPVTDEKINPKGTVTYTYKGTVYRFCCASCIADFKKDPEKYIRKMKEDAAKAKGHDHRRE